MPQQTLSTPNLKRVAAGKRNRKKRGPLTAIGREKLRRTALQNKPWLQSTGPRTAAGKAKAAANGRKRQTGSQSVREIRAALADVGSLTEQMARFRKMLE